MAKVIAELVVVPLGTATPSVSAYVAEVEKKLREFSLEIRLTPMGTILEGELPEILRAVQETHEIPFTHGALRVATTLRLDERRDKNLSMDGKIRAVEEKLS
ncbi:MAG TPA: MTH1187 family thiamine-binding protein [Synergistaceae bacterium]|nr:MTH1187 family thiamine-binding protein [Synergistaceae bacterium]HPJ24764.1 MTH1187 family thiamine-binding protein [Synergistaceae bacterium]HPQ37558.1 MTH1187 family thiamine-binding protein [Synergistaceae bacterium]